MRSTLPILVCLFGYVAYASLVSAQLGSTSATLPKVANWKKLTSAQKKLVYEALAKGAAGLCSAKSADPVLSKAILKGTKLVAFYYNNGKLKNFSVKESSKGLKISVKFPVLGIPDSKIYIAQCTVTFDLKYLTSKIKVKNGMSAWKYVSMALVKS